MNLTSVIDLRETASKAIGASAGVEKVSVGHLGRLDGPRVVSEAIKARISAARIGGLEDSEAPSGRWARMGRTKQKMYGAAEWKQTPLKLRPKPIQAELFKQLPEAVKEKMVAAAAIKSFNPKKLITNQPCLSASALQHFMDCGDEGSAAIVLKTSDGLYLHNGNHRAVAAMLSGKKFEAKFIDAAEFDESQHPRDEKGRFTGSADNILNEKTGAQAGSNPGGFYKGKDGVDRYVKFYKTPGQGHCEACANTIYRDLGVNAPKASIFEMPSNAPVGVGKEAYASEIIPGGKTLAQTGLTKANAKQIMDGFAADVLTANWDAVGTGHDNILVKDGQVHRIDNGSAFMYRAQGSLKPAGALMDPVSDYKGLMNPSVNSYYAQVAAKAGYSSPEQIPSFKHQVQQIENLRVKSGGWDKYLEKKAPYLTSDERSKISTTMNVRTGFLANKAGLPAFNEFSGSASGKVPKCPHCGSKKYSLMPTDFETAKCKNCGKTWNHGIVKGINDPGDIKTGKVIRMSPPAFKKAERKAGITPYPDVKAGGPGSGRHKIVRVSTKEGIGRCSLCGEPAVSKNGKFQHVSMTEAIAHANIHENQKVALRKKYGVSAVEPKAGITPYPDVKAGGPGSGWFAHNGHVSREESNKNARRWRNGNETNEAINGLQLAKIEHPNFDKLTDHKIDEPDYIMVPKGKHAAAGVVVKEPDGKVWIVEPKNHYGGYVNTFSKGTLDPGESAQHAAVRELHEETGLVAKVTGYLGDVERSTSVTRYYTGERVGGHPAMAGRETHAVKLVPMDSQLSERLRNVNGQKTGDHTVLDMLKKQDMQSIAAAAEWDESQHPRGPGGKFASTDAQHTPAAKASKLQGMGFGLKSANEKKDVWEHENGQKQVHVYKTNAGAVRYAVVDKAKGQTLATTYQFSSVEKHLAGNQPAVKSYPTPTQEQMLTTPKPKTEESKNGPVFTPSAKAVALDSHGYSVTKNTSDSDEWEKSGSNLKVEVFNDGSWLTSNKTTGATIGAGTKDDSIGSTLGAHEAAAGKIAEEAKPEASPKEQALEPTKSAPLIPNNTNSAKTAELENQGFSVTSYGKFDNGKEADVWTHPDNDLAVFTSKTNQSGEYQQSGNGSYQIVNTKTGEVAVAPNSKGAGSMGEELESLKQAPSGETPRPTTTTQVPATPAVQPAAPAPVSMNPMYTNSSKVGVLKQAGYSVTGYGKISPAKPCDTWTKPGSNLTVQVSNIGMKGKVGGNGTYKITDNTTGKVVIPVNNNPATTMKINISNLEKSTGNVAVPSKAVPATPAAPAKTLEPQVGANYKNQLLQSNGFAVTQHTTVDGNPTDVWTKAGSEHSVQISDLGNQTSNYKIVDKSGTVVDSGTTGLSSAVAKINPSGSSTTTSNPVTQVAAKPSNDSSKWGVSTDPAWQQKAKDTVQSLWASASSEDKKYSNDSPGGVYKKIADALGVPWGALKEVKSQIGSWQGGSTVASGDNKMGLWAQQIVNGESSVHPGLYIEHLASQQRIADQGGMPDLYRGLHKSGEPDSANAQPTKANVAAIRNFIQMSPSLYALEFPMYGAEGFSSAKSVSTSFGSGGICFEKPAGTIPKEHVMSSRDLNPGMWTGYAGEHEWAIAAPKGKNGVPAMRIDSEKGDKIILTSRDKSAAEQKVALQKLLKQLKDTGWDYEINGNSVLIIPPEDYSNEEWMKQARKPVKKGVTKRVEGARSDSFAADEVMRQVIRSKALGVACKAYKLAGLTEFQGLPISIETKKGQIRKGIGADGKPWECVMPYDYGYVRGSRGADGQHVDVFVGPLKEAKFAYGVHQNKEDGNGFDEDKWFLGFSSGDRVKQIYQSCYDGVDLFNSMTILPMHEFISKVLHTKDLQNPGKIHAGVA